MNLLKNRGITILEILIVLAIVGIVSFIVFLNFSQFRNEQALNNTTIDIVSILNKARQKTLSSINSTNYSVHFDDNKAVLFTGSVYSSVDPTNEINNFNQVVSIPTSGGLNIGGGRDVVFERLTGDTIGGTIIVRLLSDVTKQKIITINKTGVISSN